MTLTNTARITALESWKAAHELAHKAGVIHKHDPAPPPPPPPPPLPPPPPPPPTGIPPIPAGYGTKLRKDFADGQLAPFVAQTHLNDHPGQAQTLYSWFVTDAAHISVHDGYLDLRSTRNTAVADPAAPKAWFTTMVGTYTLDANPPTRTFDFQYGTVRWMAQMNSGKALWSALWYWALWGTADGAAEIDWPELIQSRLTVNLHGSAADGQKYSRTPPGPTEWHEYGIVKQPSYIAYLYDGVEVGRTNIAMPARLALIADVELGLEVPDATTPNPGFLRIAWITVD